MPKSKKIKKNLSKELVKFVDNQYLSGSSLIYEDSKGSSGLRKAILEGVAISEEIDLEIEYYSDDEKMWETQRDFYVRCMRSKE